MMEIGANTNNSPRQIPEITSTKKESVGKNISIYVANKKRKFIYRGSITKRTCEDCGHVFCSSSNLARHKRDNRCGRLHTSHLSGSWNCRRCKQIYRFYPLYVKHIKMCGKQAETVSSLHNEPQMENKQTKIIEQTIPNKKLGGFRSVLQKSFNLPSKCKVCGLNFRSILHYKTHLSRKGYCRPRPFTCYSCGKIFDTIHHLVAHENRKSPCVSTELSSPEKMASDKTDLLRNTFDVKNYNSVMGPELENQRQYFNFTGQEKEVNKEAEAGENQCEKCGIIFDSPFLCQRHKLYDSPCAISSATSTGDNSSPDIVKSSYSRRNLRARIPFSVHAPKRHSKREHQCKKCGYVFSRAYRLRSHLNRKFPCVPLRQHFLTTHSRSARKTMPPARLQNEFLYQNNLELAEQTSQDEKSKKHYKSVHSKILKKYQKITSCRPKINIEPEIKPPVCEFCNKTFVSAKSFIKHMQLHPGFVASNHPVKCPGCPEVFPNPDDLFEHQKAEKHWGPMMSRTRECECPFCGKEFLYIGRRNSHARLIHMQSNPKEVRKFLDETTCNICYRQFVDAYETYAHIQSEHQGVSPPSLERNYISASESESLSIPEEIIVNKPESLKKKIETMTPNLLALMKKYPTKCPFCLKIYSSSYVRDRHLKCHTMEKPFVCSWCKKCFPRSERLTRHYQQVHNDLLLFKCLGCGMKFPTRLQTVQHIGKAHAGASRSSLLHEIKLESSKTVQPLATEMLKEECVKKPFHYPKPGLILSPDDTVRGIYSCEVCGIHNFTKMTALHRHKKSGFHRENLKQVKSQTSKSLSGTRVSVNYNCSVCDVSYSNIVSFVPHRLSHFQVKNLDPSEINENNPYSCEICQRSIDHHQKVQAHLLWHLQADRTSRLINSTDSGAVSQAKGILSDKILIPGDSFHGKADVEIGSKTKSLENVAKKSIQTSVTLQGNVYNKSHVEKIAVDVNTEEKSQKMHLLARNVRLCFLQSNISQLMFVTFFLLK
ncbi:uncharacterized protein LOC143249554 isoform X1 [Tachypleus tridentatus]|uniref:uncharacterized protein LOC143249554 isoform X1 n=1 Tax=Tachypleus tridentatus TaxID=6853 RepID=UPI003FCFDE9D